MRLDSLRPDEIPLGPIRSSEERHPTCLAQSMRVAPCSKHACRSYRCRVGALTCQHCQPGWTDSQCTSGAKQQP
eukprot:3889761-Pleurochrysis_carterae.AAC.1